VISGPTSARWLVGGPSNAGPRRSVTRPPGRVRQRADSSSAHDARARSLGRSALRSAPSTNGDPIVEADRGDPIVGVPIVRRRRRRAVTRAASWFAGHPAASAGSSGQATTLHSPARLRSGSWLPRARSRCAAWSRTRSGRQQQTPRRLGRRGDVWLRAGRQRHLQPGSRRARARDALEARALAGGPLFDGSVGHRLSGPSATSPGVAPGRKSPSPMPHSSDAPPTGGSAPPRASEAAAGHSRGCRPRGEPDARRPGGVPRAARMSRERARSPALP
jgi:hypothetical protein